MEYRRIPGEARSHRNLIAAHSCRQAKAKAQTEEASLSGVGDAQVQVVMYELSYLSKKLKLKLVHTEKRGPFVSWREGPFSHRYLGNASHTFGNGLCGFLIRSYTAATE